MVRSRLQTTLSLTLIFSVSRGESISENSTAVKKVSGTYEGWIFGDQVDMRILTQIKGKAYDVLNGEHANDVPDDNKYYAEHRKVLREAKDTLDCLFEKQYLPPTECKRLVVPSFQATGLDGEVMAVTLPVPGLCMTQRIGYLPIPSTASELKDKCKCIKRMLFMKVRLS